MFGIELTFGQKLQAAFVIVVFGLAAVLFLRNTRAPADMTINSWVKAFYVGVNPRLPVSAKNPVDPTKSTMVTYFGCHDGQLLITEYTPESGLRARFTFMPDMHRTSFDFYQDPMAKVNSIRDPYKHTLTYAAYSAADNRPQQALVYRAGLDEKQRKAEKDARQSMLDEVTLMQEGAKTGNYHPEMYEKVLASLAAYKARPGDPAKDAAKARAAHEVMDLALAYLSRLEADKANAIGKYVSAVDGMLNRDQKDKLGEAAKLLANRGRAIRARAG